MSFYKNNLSFSNYGISTKFVKKISILKNCNL